MATDTPSNPSEFLRVITARLTEAGLSVSPYPDEDDEGVVISPAISPDAPPRPPRMSHHALCVLDIDAEAARLHCYPTMERLADPHWLADITATSPGDDGAGVVWIGDDGALCWEYEYPRLPSGPAAEAIADSIAGAVSAAIRTAWPEPAIA